MKACTVSVQREYRIGLKTLRQIGEEFGCSHTAIKKRAEREGWTRDLSAKIKEAADAKVSKAEVSKEVSKETAISERQVIDANAEMMANAVIGQRSDIKRARAMVQRLWELVNAALVNAQVNAETAGAEVSKVLVTSVVTTGYAISEDLAAVVLELHSFRQ